LQGDTEAWVGQSIRKGSNKDGIKTAAADFVRHPNFSVDPNDGTADHDLAIVRLQSPVPADMVLPLNSMPHFPDVGDDVLLIGGGRFDEVSSSPTLVQDTTLQIDELDGETCPEVDPLVEVCAGANSFNAAGERTGLCKGDSGGPLVGTVDGQKVLVGVVSFAFHNDFKSKEKKCQHSNRSAVFGRVTGYNDWIAEQICNLSANPPATCEADPVPTPGPTNAPIQAPAPNPISITSSQQSYVMGERILLNWSHPNAKPNDYLVVYGATSSEKLFPVIKRYTCGSPSVSCQGESNVFFANNFDKKFADDWINAPKDGAIVMNLLTTDDPEISDKVALPLGVSKYIVFYFDGDTDQAIASIDKEFEIIENRNFRGSNGDFRETCDNSSTIRVPFFHNGINKNKKCVGMRKRPELCHVIDKRGFHVWETCQNECWWMSTCPKPNT